MSARHITPAGGHVKGVSWPRGTVVLLGLLAGTFLAGCGAAGGPAAETTSAPPSRQSTGTVLPAAAPAVPTPTSYTDLALSAPAPEFGITVNGKLMIIDIVRGEGADKAGLQLGDVLKALNGTPLTSTDQAKQIILATNLASAANGQASILTVTRNGQDIQLPIQATPPIDRGGTPDKPLPTVTPVWAPNDYY